MIDMKKIIAALAPFGYDNLIDLRPIDGPGNTLVHFWTKGDGCIALLNFDYEVVWCYSTGSRDRESHALEMKNQAEDPERSPFARWNDNERGEPHRFWDELYSAIGKMNANLAKPDPEPAWPDDTTTWLEYANSFLTAGPQTFEDLYLCQPDLSEMPLYKAREALEKAGLETTTGSNQEEPAHLRVWHGKTYLGRIAIIRNPGPKAWATVNSSEVLEILQRVERAKADV